MKKLLSFLSNFTKTETPTVSDRARKIFASGEQYDLVKVGTSPEVLYNRERALLHILLGELEMNYPEAHKHCVEYLKNNLK